MGTGPSDRDHWVLLLVLLVRWDSTNFRRSAGRSPSNPTIPHNYCLGWANESWTGVWHGAPNRVLISQNYDRPQFHYDLLVSHFADERYVRVLDGRPVLYILRPASIPNLEQFVSELVAACARVGIEQPYIVGEAAGGWINEATSPLDAYSWNPPPPPPGDPLYGDFRQSPIRLDPAVYSYDHHYFEWIVSGRPTRLRGHSCVVVGFDNTPRSGVRGVVLEGRTPELVALFARRAMLKELSKEDPQILFLKSWNEWAEGSTIEPDSINGDSIARAIGGILRDAREHRVAR